MSLASLEAYKSYYEVRSDSKDAQHQQALDYATAIINSYCGRIFESGAPVTQTFRGDSQFYYLNEFPIQTVISATTSLDGGVTKTALAAYYLDKETGLLENTTDADFATKSCHKFLEVIYIGGFSVIPADLQHCCINIANYYLDKGFAPRRSTGVHSVDAVNERNEWPYYIQATLDIYRISTP